VVCLLYGQTLYFGYVWDDGYFLVQNDKLRRPNFSWEIFAAPIIEGASYFRPLVIMTWFLEAKLFSFTPAWSHLINNIIFLINVYLVYYIACSIYYKKDIESNKMNWAALCAALLYASHSCLVESVAWVSGRFDLLVTTFILIACIIVNSPLNLFRGGLFFVVSLCAMFSKEIGILLPFFLIINVLVRFDEHSTRFLFNHLKGYFLIFIITLSLYFVIRNSSLGVISYSGFNFPEIIYNIKSGIWLNMLSFYTFKSLLPFYDLGPQHLALEEYESSWRQSWAAIMCSFLLLANVIFWAMRRHKWAILLLGFYIGIFLVIGIIPLSIGDVIGSERFLTLPLVFQQISIVYIFLELWKKYRSLLSVILKKSRNLIGITTVFVWFLISCFSTYTYASMWRDPVLLWGWQYHKGANNKMVLHSYLVELSASKSPQAHDEFMMVIEDVRKENDGQLPREVQLIYANFLLSNDDSESLLYYRGILENNFEINDSAKGVKMMEILDKHLNYYSYIGYSTAILIFENDLKKAKYYIDEARKYMIYGEEFKIIPQELAILYASGNEDLAKEIIKERSDVMYDKDITRLLNGASNILYKYCENSAVNEDCVEYRMRFIEKLSNGKIQ